jgi:hypothetical protein
MWWWAVCLGVVLRPLPFPAMSEDRTAEQKDADRLERLGRMQVALASAIDSLGGKEGSLIDKFHFYSGVHLNRIVDSYLLLRNAGRFDGSKLLIRPAVEVMIRVHCIRVRPEFLYRFARNEREEDRKWLGPVADKHGGKDQFLKEKEAEWQEFTKKYQAEFPGHSLADSSLDLRSAAGCCGMGPYYDSHYRLYSKFIHAALGAMMDEYNSLEAEDSRTMCLCSLGVLGALSEIGASVPDLARFKTELDADAAG